MSIDREAVFAADLRADRAAAADAAQLWSDRSRARTARRRLQPTRYDPAAAETLLTDAGWTKDGDGFWANRTGDVPEIRWMVNTGNTRRENTQAFLIPLLPAGRLQRRRRQLRRGLRASSSGCQPSTTTWPCTSSTAPPDPSYLTASFTCDQIPTEENDFQGQNSTGWCNEEASAMLEEADATVDEDGPRRPHQGRPRADGRRTT